MAQATLSQLTCTDLPAFQRRAAERFNAARALGTPPHSRMMIKFDYQRALGVAVDKNCYQYVAVLLQFSEPTPHLIDDKTLVRAIDGKHCATSSPDKVACNQTLRYMQNEALHRKLAFHGRQPESFGYKPVPERYAPTPATKYVPVPARQHRYESMPQSQGDHNVHEATPAETKELVLSSYQAVLELLADTATVGNGVYVGSSRVQVTTGLFASRHFSVGDYITVYEGERVTLSHAQTILGKLSAGQLHTLRTDEWAIVGSDLVDITIAGRGGGSFAASVLDVCASCSAQNEMRCAEPNAQLIVVTDAENATAIGGAYMVHRTHLVLVATRPIESMDEIFVDLVRLSDYMPSPAQ